MTLFFYFSGITATQSEALKVAFVDRENIMLASSRTGLKFVNVSDKFYDTVQEKQKCLAMTDDEFKATVIKTFANQGYKFIKMEEQVKARD